MNRGDRESAVREDNSKNAGLRAEQELITAKEPFVSIGMPVYNGENFLRQALSSLLAQDYPRFDLIISDNASDDGTEDICREYQARDPRIRYIRHTENRGSPWNFAFVAREARGDYFMWAAHDDLWDPTFIRKCLAMLESHPEAVLCTTEINFIDGNGLPSLYFQNYKQIVTIGMTPVERIHALISLPCWIFYGLMRIEVTRHISLGLDVFAWDVIIFLEILLIGASAKVDEPLFSYRFVCAKTVEEYSRAFKSKSPVTRTAFTGALARLLETVYRSKLSAKEKTEAFAHFLLSCQKPPWRGSITQELLGPNVIVSDSQFALLVGLILNRCVPLDEFEHNPLSKTIFRSVIEAADLLQAARKVLPHLAPSDGYDDKLRRGAHLFGVGRMEEAANLFEEVLQEHETSITWSDWATVQLARNRVREAEIGLRRSLVLDSNNAQAAAKLGILLANLGRTRDSIPFLEQGIPGVAGAERTAVKSLLDESRAKLAL
jgi:glycosyltransferase involved in cell wall biosynthesis